MAQGVRAIQMNVFVVHSFEIVVKYDVFFHFEYRLHDYKCTELV